MQRAGGSQQQASLRVAVLGRGLAYRHQWLLDAEAFAAIRTARAAAESDEGVRAEWAAMK